jgi:isoleucyl-tRNA synthetase
MDPAELAPRVLAGEAITVTIADGEVELAADELEVLTEAAPGLATAEEGGVVVALSTEITPQLRAKGIAREVVRHVQDMRKQLDLAMNQEIATRYRVTPADGDVAVALRDAIAAHRDYIAGETLSGSFQETSEGAPTGAAQTSFELPEGRVDAAIEPGSKP